VKWGNGVAPQGYEDFMNTSVLFCTLAGACIVLGQKSSSAAQSTPKTHQNKQNP